MYKSNQFIIIIHYARALDFFSLTLRPRNNQMIEAHFWALNHSLIHLSWRLAVRSHVKHYMRPGGDGPLPLSMDQSTHNLRDLQAFDITCGRGALCICDLLMRFYLD